ncbi:hypothetical protein, partial [Jatrophihabitans sp.]|uniref:hypothetical protein n=1 Tax=Jatrophihabitans sp. TaxID=1932789 RepID=UPI0030C6A3AF
MGLGAFHRAHQACYTERVDPDREWGIAAFTGRSPDTARTLAAQDGLYTLIERSDSGDTFSVVGSIVEAVDGADLSRLAELVAAPATALITLTVTEAAYRVRDGALDLDADIVTDLDAMRSREPATLTTIPARLTFALAARRAAAAGPLALVPCDNLADNAGVLRIALTGFAELVEPGLARWIEEQ